jgi:hypothetical protein
MCNDSTVEEIGSAASFLQLEDTQRQAYLLFYEVTQVPQV